MNLIDCSILYLWYAFGTLDLTNRVNSMLKKYTLEIFYRPEHYIHHCILFQYSTLFPFSNRTSASSNKIKASQRGYMSNKSPILHLVVHIIRKRNLHSSHSHHLEINCCYFGLMIWWLIFLNLVIPNDQKFLRRTWFQKENRPQYHPTTFTIMRIPWHLAMSIQLNIHE